MSEYRSLRERYSLLELCRTPDLATEVTLQPVRRIEVDAAILFSDLLLPLEPMGIPFDFIQGEGPAIENPLRTRSRPRAHAPVRAARAAGLRARRDPPDQARARRPRAADRLCRRAVHARVVRDRRRPLEQLRAHQGADVRPPRGVASLLRPDRRHHRRLPRRADRSRRRLRAGVRLVGRRAERRRLPRVHPAAHEEDLRARRADSACRRFISASAPASILDRAARGRRRRDRRRLAHAARRSVGAHRPRPRASRAISIRRCCSARSTACSPPPTTSSSARGGRPGPHLQPRSRHPAVDAASSTSRRSRATCISRHGHEATGSRFGVQGSAFGVPVRRSRPRT